MISSDFEDNIYINIPEIRPSTYSIAYTFKAPLFALQDVWTSADEESEESESSAEGNQAQPGQQGGTDIAFIASIAGKLQRPMRQARLEYADGTSENKEVFSPRQLESGPSLTIHSFPCLLSLLQRIYPLEQVQITHSETWPLTRES